MMPDYRGNGIVNLMASLIKGYGGEHRYAPLNSLSPEETREYENIVLLIIDGMGQEFLENNGQKSMFAEFQRDAITSVFPATTATAVTTFVTGLAPQQHAITGWYMHLKEMGVVAAILPFVARFGGGPFGKLGITPRCIIDTPPLFDVISADSYYIIHDDLVDSDFTRTLAGSARVVGFQGFYDVMARVHEIVASHRRRKYIYAYWGAFDSLCHRHGTASSEALQHFADLAKAISRLIDAIKGTNTLVLITADHGLVDTSSEKTIKVSEHKDLIDTLTLPLCGEPRVAYCYVHPARAQQFESYVEDRFKDVCVMHRAVDLIDNGYYGLFHPHPRLLDRIGDYVLVMKDNYVMRDFVLGEKEFYFTGYHGGMSRAEMLVPLIVISH